MAIPEQQAEEWRRWLVAVLLGRGVRPDQVDDLVQAAFLRSLQARPQDELCKTYLLKAALTARQDAARRQRPVSYSDLDTEPQGLVEDPEPELDLDRLLDSLAGRERNVIELWLAGHTWQEVAQRTGVPRERLRRQWRVLRAQLRARYGEA